MTQKMTNHQIVQLAEHFGIHMQTRPIGIIDNGDGTMSFRQLELHYAGERIIELVRLMEGVSDVR